MKNDQNNVSVFKIGSLECGPVVEKYMARAKL
jgi:hypothetical protein